MAVVAGACNAVNCPLERSERALGCADCDNLRPRSRVLGGLGERLHAVAHQPHDTAKTQQARARQRAAQGSDLQLAPARGLRFLQAPWPPKCLLSPA